MHQTREMLNMSDLEGEPQAVTWPKKKNPMLNFFWVDRLEPKNAPNQGNVKHALQLSPQKNYVKLFPGF